MSSPTTRAEARRRAILARGGDRLAKLTTSARGEDAPAYMPDTGELDPRHQRVLNLNTFFVVQPPRSGAEFVGEESGLQRPSPSPSPSPLAHPDPSVWSQEQQHQFMQALMGSGILNPASGPSQSLPPPFLPPPTAGEDPLATMMAELTRMGAAPGAGVGVGGAAGKVPEPPKPPTRLRKWMPLLHLVCMWTLLAVFVLWKEPQAFAEKTAGAVEVAFWKRWPKLATQGTSLGTWGVQVVVSGLV
jgi:GET complex subunit GET2